MTDFVIVPRGPFSISLAADVVHNFAPLRHQPGLEDGVLRLGFVSDHDLAPVAVALRPERYSGVLHGTVAGPEGAKPNVEAVRRQVARIFALDVDGTDYAELPRRDPKLAGVLKEYAGLRPVSFTSPYECACWAILSQRIAKTQAANIVAQLVRDHGEVVMLEDREVRVFPRPAKLLEIDAIQSVPAVKLQRLHGIALAALEGKLDAETLKSLPEAEALARLKALPGIGDFWSSGIWLRACGVHDRFPDEPLSIDALRELHGGKMPDVARYAPFGMWIAFTLRVATKRPHKTTRPMREARAAVVRA